MDRRQFIVATLGATLLMPTVALANEPLKMEAPDALEAVKAGEMILIDVRRPAEWQDSGVASVATLLSMHEPGFLEGLVKIKQSNPNKKIAMICAVGGRTAYLQAELKRRNLGHIIDVSEGMMGNRQHPGWIARGLPVKPWKPKA